MALILIVEDGSAKSDANSYATRAEGNAYHEGHVAATDWTAATDAQKEAALVMATRAIDALFRFEGWKRTSTQTLQWPRTDCPDVERSEGEDDLPEDTLPASVRDAACELARHLIVQDRTGDPEGIGLRSLTIEGALRLVFDPLRPKPVVPQFVQAMLGRVGSYEGRRSGSVRLIRV